MFYENSIVDKLLDKARITTNQEKRYRYYKEVQNIIQENIPSITLVYTTQNVATQKNIENFKLHPTGFFELYNVKFKGE